MIFVIIIGAAVAGFAGLKALSAKAAATQLSGASSAPGTTDYSAGLNNFINASPGQGVSTVGSGPNIAGMGLGAASTGLSLAKSTSQSGLSLASSVPIIGAVVGVAAGIFTAISVHHQAAVKAEANSLNAATPHFFQGMQLIMQGVTTKQLTASQAKAFVAQSVADYYAMVKSIIKMPGATAGRPATGKLPSPCNGPCTVAYYWIEPGAAHTSEAIDNFAAGKHGTLTFDMIPPHAGFDGMNSLSINY